MIKQVVTLGGVTLPTESRSFSSLPTQVISTSGRSADGTLHEDFVTGKLSWVIQYRTLTEDTKILIDGIFNSQVNNADFPSLTFTDKDGVAQEYTVRMAPPSYGALVPQSDQFYYNGVTINLEQV
jgi:hypothetical protein